tara:strand:+ start:4777 stop:5256 length:480 start_codon:yes stop_codon:yes gene_type:complete
MYYLASDPNDKIFEHNLKICKGILPSPSYISETDENLKNIVSPYQMFHQDKEKEVVFEEIRKTHYPARPSRMGAIYLFPNLETAEISNTKWWNNQRNLYETIIHNGSIVMVADTEWLNCTKDSYEKNAHNYFQEKQTKKPLLEVVVMGVVEVSLEPINA